jgi:hypothetical protein
LFASQMTQGGLIFGAAYNAAGLGATPTWGLENQKQMMGSEMAAQGRGLNSELANRLGTMLRLDERVGGMTGDAGKILAGIRAGTMDGRLADMGYGDFLEMVEKGSGLSKNQVETALTHKQQNEEFIYNNNLGAMVSRYAQPHEANRLLLRPAAESQAHSLANKLLGRGDHRGLASRMSTEMVASWRSMNATVMADPKARTISASRDIYAYLGQEAQNNPGSEEAKLYKRLSGMTEPERNKELQMYAENAWGEAEEAGMERGLPPLVNMMLRQGVAANQEKDKITAEVTLKSALERRSAGVFQGGSPLFNFMRAMQEAGKNPNEADLKSIIAKSLGGVKKEHLAGKLASDLVALDREQDKLHEMKTTGVQQAAGVSKEATDEIERKAQEQAEIIDQMKSKIQSFLNDNGLTEVLGGMIEKEQDGEGGGSSNMTFNGATFVINAPEGTLTLKNAKGNAVAKNEGRGAGGVATQ